ncbi:MAG: DUF58 domain-containing protein [Flavobacteriales bacterium]|nr:DUF58 domain-containing protein [Flavobacteriales bacterium]
MKKKEFQNIEGVFLEIDDLIKYSFIARNIHLRKSSKVNSIMAGRHASKLRGRGMDFEESRAYVNGDDIRNIDWRVTAKLQKTYTKVFQEEKEHPAIIVTDLSKSMFFGSKKNMKSVCASQITALMAYKLSGDGDRVGGIVIKDDDVEMVKPKRDKKSLLHFLEKVVEANNELATVEFEKSLKASQVKVFEQLHNLISHDYIVVVISDFKRYDPTVIQALLNLSVHNDVIVFKVYDKLEKVMPEEIIAMTDGESQIEINGKNKKTLESIKKDFENKQKEFVDELNSYKIPVFLINTERTIEEQILEQLGL